jgi:Adenine-specific methyltransferase EcoRI
MNAVHYSDIFGYFRDNSLWLGVSIHSGDREFRVPDSYPLKAAGWRVDGQGKKYIRVKGVRWFTNIDNPKRHEELPLYKSYTPEEYPTYDNLNAIEVAKAGEIPVDYFGLMGVPDSFMDRFNPDQFELVGIPFGNLGKEIGVAKNFRGRTDIAITQNGKSRCPYSRIIIRRKVVHEDRA